MANYTMMKLPSWIAPGNKKWNKPTIGNVELPGVVHFKGISMKLRVESNKASGSDGGGSLIKGLEMPKFVFELAIGNKDDEDAWNNLAPYLLPRKDITQRGALPVYHPSLARFQIVACIVEELEEHPPLAGGPLIVVIHCLGLAPVRPGATKNVRAKNNSGIAPAYQDPVTGQTVAATTNNVRKANAKRPSQNPPLK